MISQGWNRFIQWFIIKYLKPNIYKECTAKLYINDWFENFTHEPIVFAHYFDGSSLYLYNIKI